MRRLRVLWRDYRWFLTAFSWLLALVLGYAGFARHCTLHRSVCSAGDVLYRTIQLISVESGAVEPPVPWELEVARLAIPLLTLYTAVAAFVLLFRQRVQRLRLRLLRDHVVICGAGASGSRLVRGFRQRGEQVVVIERDADSERLEACRSSGAAVLTADATNSETLEQAGVRRARCLIVVCGNDGVNAEIAVRARKLARERTGRVLTCVVQVGEPRLCELLREWEIGAEAFPGFRLELFNLFDRGAHLLLEEFPPFAPVDRTPALPPHIIVVGLGSLGASLVVHAAKVWRDRRAAVRMIITVIDREAEARCASLTARYPLLPRVADLKALPCDVRSADFEFGSFLQPAEECPAPSTVYVCLDDDALALHAGLTLLQSTGARHIPVVVRMAEEAGLADLLQDDMARGRSFRNLNVFGLLDRACTPELVLGGAHEILAQALHAEYIRTRSAAGETVAANPSLAPWNLLPEPIKESNRRQVDHIPKSLRAVGCQIVAQTNWENPSFELAPEQVETMARLEHARWCEEHTREGWRYAAGSKDLSHKVHPDLVPWEGLPDAEQEKDRALVRGLPGFLSRAGLQIVPMGEQRLGSGSRHGAAN